MADPNGTFLQIAYGGYMLVSPSTTVKETLVYSEPGFTTMSPIEFAIPKSDQFYFIIRKRNNIFGTTFEDTDITNLVTTVTDATWGINLESNLEDFSSSVASYDANWEDGQSDAKKVILTVNSGTPLADPVSRIRVIDCKIKDKRDNAFLSFRVLVDDSNKVFNYLLVDSNTVTQRDDSSTSGSTLIAELDGEGDSHILISPFASFFEVSKGSHDFDYPLNTIFYKRQSTYNKENFTYQISGYSDSFLLENVRIKNVPGYPQMGVVIIDRNLFAEIASVEREIYVDLEVRGIISEMRDTFRVNFVRT
jgi:hypothetical protein